MRMKEFFKFFTASCLGVFAAFILVFFVFAGFLGSMMGGKPVVPKNTVLEIDLSAVPERSDNVEVSILDAQNTNFLGMHDAIKLIDHAADDDKVQGILIKGESGIGGQVTALRIREAIEGFKESGKFVYAYGDFYSQMGYYLGSTADSIFINPSGAVDIRGFSTMIPFYKKAMNKLGVKMNIFYAGNFKSATEPYRRSEMSEPNKLQTSEYLTGMVNKYIDGVAASRGLSTDQVNDIMTNYAGRDAASCLDNKLVDQISYFDDVEILLRERMGLKKGKKIKYKTLSEYKTLAKLKEEDSKDDKIAVVYAEGIINYNASALGDVNIPKYRKALQKIRHDDDIKAMVLRVNSPGGNALTSDILWNEIERIKELGKPVVASFGDYAASGGYYIAAGADTIVSAPNTLTGSIGVFMMFPDVSELASEKVGVTFDDVRTHPMAAGLSPFEALNDQEKEILQEGTDQIYETFLKRVSDGRGMSRDAVHEVAQGRVWLGDKAQELGLVDVIGDLADAIKIAGEMADIDSYSLKSYPTIKEDPFKEIVQQFMKEEDVSLEMGLDAQDLKVFKEIRSAKEIISDRTPQARLPFVIQLN